MRLSEAERAQSRSANSIDSLKKQNQDLTHRLTLATQEKVNALLQLAADGNSSHGAAGSKGVVPSPQKASTWKVHFTRVNLSGLSYCAVLSGVLPLPLSRFAAPCRPMPCRPVLCCAVLCCAVLCCAVLCCAVLAYLYCLAFAMFSVQS